MQTQINTGNGIENREALEQWADSEVRQSLARFAGDVTRVEVHLNDESHGAGGGSTRCVMEARLAKHQPATVAHQAATMDEAFRGAADKLKRLLDSTLGRLNSHRDRDSIRKDENVIAP